MNLGVLLFSYQGRINRAKYWLAALVYLIATMVIVGCAFIIPLVGMVVAVAGYIAILASSIMIGIKRLHDRDKSGWWLVVFIGGPVLLGGFGLLVDDNWLVSLLNAAITIWMIVELGCLRGTAGPNQYGPDPLPAPAIAAA
jgi:uncharacterized membrane protein YhaH (DUF805 family)